MFARLLTEIRDATRVFVSNGSRLDEVEFLVAKYALFDVHNVHFKCNIPPGLHVNYVSLAPDREEIHVSSFGAARDRACHQVLDFRGRLLSKKSGNAARYCSEARRYIRRTSSGICVVNTTVIMPDIGGHDLIFDADFVYGTTSDGRILKYDWTGALCASTTPAFDFWSIVLVAQNKILCDVSRDRGGSEVRWLDATDLQTLLPKRATLDGYEIMCFDPRSNLLIANATTAESTRVQLLNTDLEVAGYLDLGFDALELAFARLSDGRSVLCAANDTDIRLFDFDLLLLSRQ